MSHSEHDEGDQEAHVEPTDGAVKSPTALGGPAPYRALEGSEIRLLRVAPGGWDDQVSCTMHYVPLDERPEYVALSYTWGDASDQVEILLDGWQHRVTRSLFTALRRFRKLCAEGRSYDGFTFSCPGEGGGTTYIWADALCINQEDGREKVTEIPRMGDLYSLCSRTCVWLGENDGLDGEEEEGRAMMEEIERWLESRPCGKEWPAEVPDDGSSPPLQRRDVEEHFGPRLNAFLRLWCEVGRRVWFTRVWIIQEVALPPTDPIIMAGGYLLSFEGFTGIWSVVAGILVTTYPEANHEFIGQHGALFRSRTYAQENPVQAEVSPEDRRVLFGRALGDALVRQGPGIFQATVPHDYLYSMIGLCGGGALLPPELAPDYQKPFPQVCEEYAKCIMKATGSVAMLGRPRCDLYWDFGTPPRPWVPDFRSELNNISVEGESDPSAVSFMGPENEMFLKVRGFEVGKIVRVHAPLRSDNENEISFGEHLRHHRKFLAQVAREWGDMTTEDAAWNWMSSRIKTNTIWSEDEEPQSTDDLLPIYNHYLQLDDYEGSDADSLRDSYTARKFVLAAKKMLQEGVCVLLEGGFDAEFQRTGTDPPKRGDLVLGLSGSKEPFIVRPVTTKQGDGYVLLGYCWLFDRNKPLQYTADDFSLESYDESDFEYFMIA